MSSDGAPRAIPANAFVGIRTAPALAPDARRVAYLCQQGSLVNVLGFWTIVGDAAVRIALVAPQAVMR